MDRTEALVSTSQAVDEATRIAARAAALAADGDPFARVTESAPVTADGPAAPAPPERYADAVAVLMRLAGDLQVRR